MDDEMSVKALEAVGPNELVLRDFPRPDVADDAMLLKVVSCGVCGTDLANISGKREVRFPIIPGHEVAGVIGEIGANALERMKVFGGNVTVGDLVALNPRIECGKCYYCRNFPDHPSMCIGGRSYNSSISSADPPHLFGGWAECMYILPGSSIARLPDGIDPAVAALAEPFACALTVLERYRKISISRDSFGVADAVVVFGVGAIGMLVVAAFRLAGARRIVAIDADDKRLGLSVEFGTTERINVAETSPDERIAAVRKVTDGLGAGVAVEACGVPDVIGEAVQMLRRGGILFDMGHASKTRPAEIDPHAVCRNEITIAGSYAYASTQCFVDAGKLLHEAALPYKKLVGSFPLADYRNVLFGRPAGRAVKNVFRM